MRFHVMDRSAFADRLRVIEPCGAPSRLKAVASFRLCPAPCLPAVGAVLLLVDALEEGIADFGNLRQPADWQGCSKPCIRAAGGD